MLSPLRNRAGKRLREPFGKAGLMVAVIALVFAMLGGAYAATSDGGKATASAKAKKGPRGPKGATGPAGPAGPAGASGAKGDKGDGGSAGSDGKGTETASFAGSKTVGGVTCSEGGVEVKSVSGATLVCNGKKGNNGAPGSPWTAGGTLPSGKTETGAWAFGEITAGSKPIAGFSPLRYPISFNIPLATEISATGCETEESGHVAATCHVHFINAAGKEVINLTEEMTSTVCSGTAAAPTAPAGNLCVYAGKLEKALASSGFIEKAQQETAGASTAGAVLSFLGVEEEAVGFGTWAVTAE